MSAIALALGWWVNVVLPVVIGLNVLGAIVFLCVRRASWRFQSWVFLGLLVAFALVLGGPLYPKREVTREVQVVHVVKSNGAEPAISAVSRSDSASWTKLLPIVGGIWILGILVSLWRLGRSQWALRKLVGKSEPLADGPLEAAFGKRVRSLLERNRISVLQTDVDVSPCCFGWLQRRVVFPSAMLERLKLEERDLVLRHEILHLTSGDVLLLYFQRLMEALYWWNPVVAKISDSLSQAREGLCDEALVKSGAESQTYASVLIQLGELSSQRLSSAVSGSPVYRCLKLRLERIMNGRPPSRKLAWCGGAVALGVCASAVFAVVQVGHVVPEPRLSAAKERPLQLSDFPTLELFGYFESGEFVLFEGNITLAVGETIDVQYPLPSSGLSAQLTYLGMIDGNIQLRWSSEKGVLEQEIKLAPEIPGIVPRNPDPWPTHGPKIYDTPPVRPEDPLKEVDGDPSVAKATRRPRDGGGGVDVRGFGVVSVNVINQQEGSKEIANTAGNTKTLRLQKPVATEWPLPDESVMQAWMGTNSWVTTTVSEVPALLERGDVKSTPGNGWFRLEEVSSSPDQRVTRSSLERGYYDDPEFTRRHVERGLKELQQDWPGQLLIEDRQSVE